MEGTTAIAKKKKKVREKLSDIFPFSINIVQNIFFVFAKNWNVPKGRMSVTKPYSSCICTAMLKGP